MNVLVKQSMLYHLHHAAYSKMKNQYPIQTVVAVGPNGTWTSTDLLGFVTIIVTNCFASRSTNMVRQAPFLQSYKRHSSVWLCVELTASIFITSLLITLAVTLLSKIVTWFPGTKCTSAAFSQYCNTV